MTEKCRRLGSLQKRLLSEEDSLTFERAQKIALAVETAAKGSRQLTTEQPSRDSREVNRVEARSFNPPPPPAGRKQRPTPPPPNRYVKRDCYRCGGSHSPQMCRFKGYRCHSCGALGHLSRCCRQNEQDKQPATRTNRVGEDGTDEPAQVDDESEVCSVYTVGRQKSPPITAEVMVCGVPVTFEVDTGAASTLMNKETFEAVRTVGGDIGLELQHSEAHLRTYTGERIPVEGEFSAVIRYDGQHLELPALVVDTTGPNLLGRDWLRVLKLNWQDIKQVRFGDDPRFQELKKKYADVFSSELGCLKDVEVKFELDESVSPRFCRARNIPYAYRKQVEEQLEAEVEAGILEPVRTSEWACQIVPIVKPDGTVVWRSESRQLWEFSSARWRGCWRESPEPSYIWMTSCCVDTTKTSFCSGWNVFCGSSRRQDSSIITECVRRRETCCSSIIWRRLASSVRTGSHRQMAVPVQSHAARHHRRDAWPTSSGVQAHHKVGQAETRH
ncbi:uncharacterized protein K02A2.6-like isoform X6 [Amphibalanus amphitrite]|uniref:uncharacterized protein K02A2.6-like isoform X6 n=1 Tax=Amphibalanus amphitrite TaxID=1232801 RepID=UPI001C9009A7|nr:uncharacterized protein K02A2.6-like isoform X6 [Amphibalanus amphitrite]